MAETLTIRVDESGARVVSRRIEDVGKSAKKAGKEASVLRSALRLLGGALLIREYKRLSDTFTNIQNRLKTVTDGSKELAAVTQALRRVSNQTRSSFEGTAELYARMGLAAKDLGTSQQELIDFTKSLNQAVILSGASAQEAENAIIQLSQGIASGALRGDELRSVLEQLPVVADVIAQQLKVTRGELREMGKQGKITADVVLDAFKASREELEQGFAKTTPTIGQALTVLRNEVIAFVGSFNQATGSANGLASAILFIAENVQNVGRLIIVTFNAAERAIGFVVDQVGRLLSAIGDLVSSGFGDLEFSFKNALILGVFFVDKMVAGFRLIGQAILTGITVPIAGAALLIGEFVNTIIEAINDAVRLAEKAAEKVADAADFLAGGLDIPGLGGQPSGPDISGFSLSGDLPTIDTDVFKDIISDEVSDLGDAIADFASTEASAIASSIIGDIESLFQSTTSAVSDAAGKNRIPKAPGKGDPVKEAEDLLTLGADLNAMATAANDQLEREAALLAEIRKLDEIQRMEDLLRLYEQGAITLGQYAEALRQVSGAQAKVTITDPIDKWFKTLSDDAANLDTMFRETLVGAFGDVESALVKLTQTGELSFRQMAESMEAALARLIIRFLAFKALTGLGLGLGSFGGGGGGLGDEILAPAFAHGGQFMVGGQPGVDQNLVAFRASQGERVTVETKQQQRQNDRGGASGEGGQGGDTTIVNAMDPSVIESYLGGEAGRRIVLNVISENPDILRRLGR